MKVILIFFGILIYSTSFSQSTDEAIQEIVEARLKHIEKLQDVSKGVLNAQEIKELGKITYFPYAPSFCVTATFKKNKGEKFQMPTSTDRKPWYRRYGYIEFEFKGESFQLTVYKNLDLKGDKYKNYYFIPFKDKTSGNETYGGGRYMDLYLTKSNEVSLDFNKAYNPYCAYSVRYSCPIPPLENTLEINVLAGEKTPTSF